MKILGKVKPEYDTCCGCLDEQTDGIKQAMACSECLSRIPYSEIIKIGHSFWIGDYAMVLTENGHIKRYPLDRIFNVHTEHNAMDGFQRGFRAMTKAVDDYAKHQLFEEFKED